MFVYKSSIILMVLFLCAISFQLHAKKVITISDQFSFDNLQQELTNAVNFGEKDIYVTFLPGYYVAHEKNISISNINSPSTNIHFVGNAAVILPVGNVYRDGDTYTEAFNPGFCWMNGSKEVNLWTKVRYSDSLVEILDEERGLCRIKSREPIAENLSPDCAYIHIPHWFRSSIYKIQKVKNQYIYFSATDLEHSPKKGYNVNDDYNLGKRNIRYKLCNLNELEGVLSIKDGIIRLPSDVSSVREGKMLRFLTIENSELNSVEITGISFYGNCYGNSNSLFSFSNTEVRKMWIHGCNFHGIKSNVIAVSSTNNVKIEKNAFADCYYSGIVADNKSKNTVVQKNTFINMGKGLQNSFCVVCRGSNYYIANNKITDFGYGGVGIGVWFKSKQDEPCNGIVEKNDLSYTKSYMSDIDNNCIMDGGAIYVWTKNDRATIRYNYIHDFSGAGGNRGIFCDDGAYNVQIYGNVITGIVNNNCIESRRVASVENTKTKGTDIDRSNVNIEIRENIVDGNIFFVGNEDLENGCVKGSNYVLITGNSPSLMNTIKNVSEFEEDITLDYNGEKNGCVGISKKSYCLLRKVDIWRSIRGYIIRKD